MIGFGTTILFFPNDSSEPANDISDTVFVKSVTNDSIGSGPDQPLRMSLKNLLFEHANFSEPSKSCTALLQIYLQNILTL